MRAQVRACMREESLGELYSGRRYVQALRPRILGIRIRLEQRWFLAHQLRHRITHGCPRKSKRVSIAKFAYRPPRSEQHSEKNLKLSRLPTFETIRAAARIDETRNARELERSPG